MSPLHFPRGFAARAGLVLALGVTLFFGWRVAATLRDPVGPVPAEGFEALRASAAYRTSQSCVPCHAGNAASWRRSFHRSMTQEPGPETIQAPFDGRAIDVLGVRTVPRRGGDAFFLDTVDSGGAGVDRRRVARVTGSRRMQQFEIREGDRYIRQPIAWSMEEQRWLHLSESFFHPDGESYEETTAVWDLNCIFCHTTKPVPGLDAADRIDSRAAELGIACEACHGPGEEHVRRMRSPLRRFAFRSGHPVDPTIVNPARIDKVRSVQVCGHCHGQRLPAEREGIRKIMREGDPYTPGEDLSRYFVPITRETTLGSFSFASRFWADGSPRLTAYEYQGVLRSPCYLRGELTCMSCHTMHWGDPRGQLRSDVPGDALCTQCHTEYQGERASAHTHHRSESSGSRCIACHMPPVVFGIMTWHPTHEISTPQPAAAAALHKPESCTVCHTGRSLAWAVESSRRFWPGHEAHEPSPVDRGDRLAAPELVRALFAGDVVYRTLAAARLSVPSPDAEVADRVVPLLAELLIDPYPNVRRTARLGLVRLTGNTDLPQALDALELRDAARRELQASGRAPGSLSGWPFLADGTLNRARLEQWKRERQEVPVSIGE